MSIISKDEVYPAIALQGHLIDSIPALYAEFNRVFMATEDWKIGQSLDALDDLLYGGYGLLAGKENPVICWQHHKISQAHLGLEATRAYYQQKLQQPEVFNSRWVRQQLADLNSGQGKTYFHLVVEVFSDHKNITLLLD